VAETPIRTGKGGGREEEEGGGGGVEGEVEWEGRGEIFYLD
jgi:hypothetical protein